MGVFMDWKLQTDPYTFRTYTIFMVELLLYFVRYVHGHKKSNPAFFVAKTNMVTLRARAFLSSLFSLLLCYVVSRTL